MSAHSCAGRSHCQNCGSPLTGPYCSACGQHDVDYHRSVWPILEDSVEGFLHLDGKFLRTVRWLFTRPGFLTNEFNAGKRVSYTQPLRLYIFASFLYFALHFLFNHKPIPIGTGPAVETTAGETPQHGEARPTRPGEASTGFGRMLEHMNSADRKEVAREWRHLVPTMAFFLLPILAAVLLLAYRQSGRVYVEHMIFALHLQTFFFLAALSADIVQAAIGLVSVSLAGLAGVIIFVAGAWQIYRAFRVVYAEGRWKTTYKVALVAAIYGIILLIGIALTAAVAELLALRSA